MKPTKTSEKKWFSAAALSYDPRLPAAIERSAMDRTQRKLLDQQRREEARELREREPELRMPEAIERAAMDPAQRRLMDVQRQQEAREERQPDPELRREMHQAHAERLERLVQQQQERDAERKQAQERRERKQRERDEKRKQAQRVGTPVVASLEPDLEAMSVVVAAHLIGLVAPGGPWAGYYVYPCQGYEHTMTLPAEGYQWEKQYDGRQMRWRKNQIGAEFLTKLFRPGSQHLRGATLVKFGDINARWARTDINDAMRTNDIVTVVLFETAFRSHAEFVEGTVQAILLVHLCALCLHQHASTKMVVGEHPMRGERVRVCATLVSPGFMERWRVKQYREGMLYSFGPRGMPAPTWPWMEASAKHQRRWSRQVLQELLPSWPVLPPDHVLPDWTWQQQLTQQVAVWADLSALMGSRLTPEEEQAREAAMRAHFLAQPVPRSGLVLASGHQQQQQQQQEPGSSGPELPQVFLELDALEAELAELDAEIESEIGTVPTESC